MSKPLEKEYEFYKEIRWELARDHDGKLVAIKGRQVLGIFDDYRHAANALYTEHDYGTVLIQTISNDPDANIIYLPTFVVVEAE